VVLAPQLGIRDFAAMLSRCTLVVTGDTGPMHLAAAVGTPTVAVFRTTNAQSYAPRGPLHRAIQTPAEEAIGRVVAAVEDILAQGVGRPRPRRRSAGNGVRTDGAGRQVPARSRIVSYQLRSATALALAILAALAAVPLLGTVDARLDTMLDTWRTCRGEAVA